METVANDVMTFLPKNNEPKWIATDYNNKILSEGKTIVEASDGALKITTDYILNFVPKEGETYIF